MKKALLALLAASTLTGCHMRIGYILDIGCMDFHRYEEMPEGCPCLIEDLEETITDVI